MLRYIIDPDFNYLGRRTICEVHRELYRAARARGDTEAMDKIAEAYDMGKRMDAKLREYRRLAAKGE